MDTNFSNAAAQQEIATAKEHTRREAGAKRRQRSVNERKETN